MHVAIQSITKNTHMHKQLYAHIKKKHYSSKYYKCMQIKRPIHDIHQFLTYYTHSSFTIT